MKKITFLLLLLVSFASLKAQDLSNADIKKGIEDGVVSFVKSVKSTVGLEPGLTFEEFKTNLIGTSNLNSIPVEGNDLLSITYQMIIENADESQIKTKGYRAFLHATKYVLENEAKVTNPSKTLKNGGNLLFGGNESAFKGYDSNMAGREAAGGGCGDHRDCPHWYNFGCHLHNVGVWMCEHKDLLAAISYALAATYYLIQIL